MTRLLALAGGLGLLAGCPAYPFVTEGSEQGLRTLAAGTTSDGSGLAQFSFDVATESSGLLTFVPGEGYRTYVSALYSPSGAIVLDGEAWANSAYSITGGVYLDKVASVNWPVLEEDVFETGTWVAEVGVTDPDGYFVSGADIAFHAQLKEDGDLFGGTLGADIIYVGSVPDDTEAVLAIEEAVAYWQDIYAGVGITLVPEYWELDGPDFIAPPGDGNAADYVAIANETAFRSVNVIVVQDIDSPIGGLFGIAGGIPGPLVATGNSGVAVSVLTNAGPDLTFSSGDIQLMGETIAHEVGHFIGLHHPVEQTMDSWDALDDTPDCGSQGDCEDVLGGNLMYPYPLCGGSSCQPQNDLTSQQAGVANRYAAVE